MASVGQAVITTASEDLSPVANDDLQTSDESSSCLHISTTTWARDSHELFDYEARHVHKRSYFLRRAARVFRTTLEVQVVPEGHPFPTQAADYLLSVRHRAGRFIVVPADKNTQTTGATAILPKKVWLIVKELPTGCHHLQEGDVIKLGRFKLRVKQLVKAGPTVPELRLDDLDTPHSTVTPEEALTMQCRICLLDGGTVEDPLVCPCQCKGSIKFVHLDCLRHWINGRLSLPEDDQQQKMSFFFKQLQCELCKTPFPSALILNSERVPIVRVPKIEAPFIILENIVGTANRGLHVISMETKKELKLGRGHESDVRIADVSISRYHATIRFLDGEFILEDHNSKFGTLVSLRKIQPIDPSHALAVQVGRTILNMSLRRPPCSFEDVLAVNGEDPLPTLPGGGESQIDETNSNTNMLNPTNIGSNNCPMTENNNNNNNNNNPPLQEQGNNSNHSGNAPFTTTTATNNNTNNMNDRRISLALLQQRDLYDRLASAIMAVRESGMNLTEPFDTRTYLSNQSFILRPQLNSNHESVAPWGRAVCSNHNNNADYSNINDHHIHHHHHHHHCHHQDFSTTDRERRSPHFHQFDSSESMPQEHYQQHHSTPISAQFIEELSQAARVALLCSNNNNNNNNNDHGYHDNHNIQQQQQEETQQSQHLGSSVINENYLDLTLDDDNNGEEAHHNNTVHLDENGPLTATTVLNNTHRQFIGHSNQDYYHDYGVSTPLPELTNDEEHQQQQQQQEQQQSYHHNDDVIIQDSSCHSFSNPYLVKDEQQEHTDYYRNAYGSYDTSSLLLVSQKEKPYHIKSSSSSENVVSNLNNPNTTATAAEAAAPPPLPNQDCASLSENKITTRANKIMSEGGDTSSPSFPDASIPKYCRRHPQPPLLSSTNKLLQEQQINVANLNRFHSPSAITATSSALLCTNINDSLNSGGSGSSSNNHNDRNIIISSLPHLDKSNDKDSPPHRDILMTDICKHSPTTWIPSSHYSNNDDNSNYQQMAIATTSSSTTSGTIVAINSMVPIELNLNEKNINQNNLITSDMNHHYHPINIFLDKKHKLEHQNTDHEINCMMLDSPIITPTTTTTTTTATSSDQQQPEASTTSNNNASVTINNNSSLHSYPTNRMYKKGDDDDDDDDDLQENSPADTATGRNEWGGSFAYYDTCGVHQCLSDINLTYSTTTKNDIHQVNYNCSAQNSLVVPSNIIVRDEEVVSTSDVNGGGGNGSSSLTHIETQISDEEVNTQHISKTLHIPISP